MAYRVTGAEVLEIFETDLTASELLPFIASANALINYYDDLTELDDDLTKQIELYLSAHYASAMDQRISYQSYGMSKVKFQGEYKTSLYATDYGQRAVDLDPTGTLCDLAKGVKTARIVSYPVTYPSTYGTEDDYRG